MALIILLSFCLILEVHPQYVSQPQLVVSSTERGSVQLDCKTPYAGVSQCHFYPEKDYKNLKHSLSCQLSLTDSELTSWTGRSYSPPEPVSVICYYSVSESGLTKPSPHSLPATVLEAPQLSVSPSVLTERGSVQLDCKTLYAGVSQCYFYPERDETNIKHSPSCQLSLTDSELTRWTGRSYSSPEPVSVICYYTVSESGLTKPSPHSLPATVTVLEAPQLSVSPSVLTQRGSIQLDCKTPYAGVSQCYFYPERDKTNIKHSPSCQLSLTDSELTRWTGHSNRSPEPVSVICFYTVSKSGVSKPSPHSLPATVTVLDKKPAVSVIMTVSMKSSQLCVKCRCQGQ
ncbi:uncharacterized protein LOC118799962 [Colossoma macropomum]|uniref:uncharacterized protein LOC118799962 n=1 Tax=Colossoma macropomum TaxID=42526 RepID=UPI0018652008|nr:uncharacterized protein LOC118799962 [Colossoma macropomum]